MCVATSMPSPKNLYIYTHICSSLFLLSLFFIKRSNSNMLLSAQTRLATKKEKRDKTEKRETFLGSHKKKYFFFWNHMIMIITQLGNVVCFFSLSHTHIWFFSFSKKMFMLIQYILYYFIKHMNFSQKKNTKINSLNIFCVLRTFTKSSCQ